MSGVDDLVKWLRAQLDEDERAARAWLPLGNPTAADREHIARWDPARVLAEVEAKRRRLERHQPNEHFLHGTVCAWCSVPQAGAYQSWPCPDVRDDAAPYADRPGYRDEWRP